MKSFFISVSSKPFLFFLPFLGVYISVVLMFFADEGCLTVDGVGYLVKSSNLLNGYYSPSTSDAINLEHGPGYPLFLMPFVALKVPHFFICLANALFHYLAVVFLYKALRLHHCRPAICLAAGLSLACYYPAFLYLPYVCRENMSIFLSALLLYVSSYAFHKKTLASLITAGFVFAFLVLTKVIFGHVLLVMTVVFALLFAVNVRSRPHVRPFLGMMGFAWLFVSPYLLYTYSLTHKFLYFSTSGGLVLYCMSTPHPEEYGDAFVMCDTSILTEDLKVRQNKMYTNHKDDMDYFYSDTLDPVTLDEAYRKRAWQNIQQHPLKFLKNCAANASRMFFETPDSYYPQQYRPIVFIPPHSLLLVFIVLSVGVLALNYRSLSCLVAFVLLLTMAYVGGTLLLSAYIRMIFPAVPPMLFLIGYTFDKYIRVRITTDFLPDTPSGSPSGTRRIPPAGV